MRRVLRTRVLVPLAVAVLLAAGGAFVYAQRNPTAVRYRVQPATLGTVTQTLPLSGNLAAVNQADIDFLASGRVASVLVRPGDTVRAGDVLATLDPLSLQGSLTQARAGLSSAEARLSLDLAGPTAQALAQAQAQVNSAAVSLQNAKAALVDTVAVNVQAVNAAQSAVDQAQATLSSDQSTYDGDNQRLQNDQARQANDCNASPSGQACSDDQKAVNSDQQKVNADQQAVSHDQSSLTAAQNSLAATQTRAQQADDQAQAQVNSADVQLQNARLALAALQQGSTPQQVEMDRSQVLTAQVSVQNAQRALDQATLTAPVAGVVNQVNLVVGQTVSAGGAGGTAAASTTHAFAILAPGAFEVTGAVSDAQVNQVVSGQRARITPAGSAQALNGTVSQVAPVATVTSGVATFPVTVLIDGDNPGLHAGVSASVDVIVNQVVHVLTVPTSALRTAGGATTVQLLVNGQPQVTPVTIGASDPIRTQVLSGLNAGDSVVIATISSRVPTTTNGGGGLFGGAGGAGGRGGGGFRGGGVGG